jgi:hypothetical protein
MTASRSNRQYFPMDPTEIYGGVQINIMAARTFLPGVPKICFWSQQNAHLKFHFRLHSACELRWTNYLAIIRAHHFIIASLNKVEPEAISAMCLDNIVKILGGGDL